MSSPRSSAQRFWISGCLSASAMAASSFARIGSGVPAGAPMPYHDGGDVARQRLGDRRNVGRRLRALGRGDAQPLQLAAPHLRQHRRHVGEHHLHRAGDQVVVGRAGALVGHMDDVDAGHGLEQLAAEMQRRARSRRGEGILARLLLAERDQLGDRVGRQRLRHAQKVRQHGDARDADDVLVGDRRAACCRASGSACGWRP